MRARYYDVNTGTFISREPTGQDGPNLYWYARNNPLKYRDPDGLEAIPEHLSKEEFEEQIARELAVYDQDDSIENDPLGEALLLGAAVGATNSVYRSGVNVWARQYPNAGGVGIGLNKGTRNLVRFDIHTIKKGGRALPHVDIPGKVKHWPWKK